jgi:hypothetical protein
VSTRARRVAQQRRQEELARQRAQARRRRLYLAGGGVATVLLVIAVLVVVKLVTPNGGASAAPASGALSPAVTQALSVNPAVLDQIGKGRIDARPSKLASQPALTADGKPLVLYVGAEYCPYCAAQRWGLVVALSRFGTFSGLKAAHSGADDVFPSTATVSFYGSTYTSSYLTFQGVELSTSERQGARYAPLQSLTSAQDEVMRKYNAPPFVAAESAGAVPFVDFGNQYLMTGSSFSPSLLKGLTQEQVANSLSDPSNPLAQSVIGSANAMTTVLCQLTGGQPANVCTGSAATVYTDATNG